MATLFLLLLLQASRADPLYTGDAYFESEPTDRDDYFYGKHPIAHIESLYIGLDESLWKDGHSRCQCSEDSDLPSDYGFQCAQHDYSTDKCQGATKSDAFKPEGCFSYWCYVDAGCELDHGIDETNGLIYSYATCGYLDGADLVLSLKDETVYYTQITDRGYDGDVGGTCGLSKSADYPAGCKGLAVDLAEEFRVKGQFNVEYVQAFPDQFWHGIATFCRFYNGDEWTTNVEIEPHVCTGQRWTACTWAAAMGYTDLCIGALYPTDERAELVSGFKLVDLNINMYTQRQDTKINLLNLQIFKVWSTTLWIAAILTIPFVAFCVKLVGGYYQGFIATPANIFIEVGDTIFWAAGMFLDVIYPQNMPTGLSKFLLIVFELCQCFLLATITASLTKVLLVETNTAIRSVAELHGVGGIICFRYSTQGIKFGQNYPSFPSSKIYVDDVCEENCLDFAEKLSSGDCQALGETETQMKKNHALGTSCEWSPVERLWSSQFWMPASEHVYDALHAIWGTMYNDGTLTMHRLNSLTAAGLTENKCTETSDSSDTSLQLSQVSGIIFGAIFCSVAVLLLHFLGICFNSADEEITIGQTDLGYRRQKMFNDPRAMQMTPEMTS